MLGFHPLSTHPLSTLGTILVDIEGDIDQNLPPVSQQMTGTLSNIKSGGIVQNLPAFNQVVTGEIFTPRAGSILNIIPALNQALVGLVVDEPLDGNINNTIPAVTQLMMGQLDPLSDREVIQFTVEICPTATTTVQVVVTKQLKVER